MQYTKVPADTFQHLQMNAGILAKSFVPSTGVVGDLLGATTGGINFDATPTYTDLGSDIDNCPKNTKELKKQDDLQVVISGTFLTVTAASAKSLVGPADIDSLDATHIKPRMDIEDDDFEDLWWIGDYSDENIGASAGFIAIHVMNGLNTGGFKIKSTDKNKGQFAFNFMGHFSIEDPDEIPFEIYVREGTSEAGGYRMDVLSEAGSTANKTEITVSETAGSGESYVYQTGAKLHVPAVGATLVGSAWTAWDGSSEITSATGLDIIVAIIDSDHKSVHAGKTLVTVAE